MNSDPSVWTVRKVLDWTRQRFEREGLDTPRLDAEILVAAALQMPRIGVYTQHDRPLTQAEREVLRGLVQRRLEREPVAYLTGYKEFWSRDFRVTPDVLIPRPDTELMVEHVLDHHPKETVRTVVDVGTGSGAIAMTLALERPTWTVWATDVSGAALVVAAENARRFQLGPERMRLFEGPYLPPDVQPDVVVANLPYIPSEQIAELAPDVSRHEPRLALDGGPDGLDPIRELVRRLSDRGPGPWLYLEAGPDQHAQIRELLQADFRQVRTLQDLGGMERVTCAWPIGAT